ncbi:hypothetical protein BaRGS_00009734 [Batillaria attramentaria]|uniref:Uncharacterized protein n=1 Tax=Batillaria attramentaria TaxID=370345 RepID=A0ABD0LHQ2_9CAEN
MADDSGVATQTETSIKKRDSAAYSTSTVMDHRPSAIAFGAGAIVLFVGIMVGILLLDVTTIWRHLAIMKENLSGVCGREKDSCDARDAEAPPTKEEPQPQQDQATTSA